MAVVMTVVVAVRVMVVAGHGIALIRCCALVVVMGWYPSTAVRTLRIRGRGPTRSSEPCVRAMIMMVTSFVMPDNLVDAARCDNSGQLPAWLATVPSRLTDLQERWALTLGQPFQPGGRTAWVAPARTATGDDLVLKVLRRHPEALHEAAGLRLWDGRGAVRLYAEQEFDDTIALLIERCLPGTPLAVEDGTERDVVIAALLPRLWLEPEPGHPFRTLGDMCEMWAHQFERKWSLIRTDLDPGLVRAGIALFRSLPGTADRNVLLCTDLHAENVLAAGREPWLVIDPKPYVGDPTYDALQHMLNCADRLHADAPRFARRMAGLLGLDGDRLLQWLFARCVQESLDRPDLGEVARHLPPT